MLFWKFLIIWILGVGRYLFVLEELILGLVDLALDLLEGVIGLAEPRNQVHHMQQWQQRILLITDPAQIRLNHLESIIQRVPDVLHRHGLL